MKCDWCGRHNDTYDISFGGSVLQICGCCYMGIQRFIFGEE
jgi:ribosome-binding protein aMBF1 (putative translation factor)